MKTATHLAEQFRPEHYDLLLDIDRAAASFSGKVIIKGRKIGRPTGRLTFHQKKLKITSASVVRHDKKQGNQVLEIDRINTHESYDEVRLHTKQPVLPGEFTISLEFTGKITEQMHGIYPSQFELAKEKKQLIGTQFESHHAREVFPCIDEPAAKATFDLTLITPAGEAVLANTPIKQQKKADGSRLQTSFETTPVMSTYLLAFVFGELEGKQATTKNGTLIKVWSTPDKVDQTEYALDVAVKTLEYFEEYFDIPFPLPKCDFVALPDFAAGAMENWGLITFREIALLVDKKHTALDVKQYVATVVAHELAHQWFGNLVTMAWWTDLWLNEGFASWIEYLAVDHLFPEWHIWEQFVSNEYLGAISLDSLVYTHPIEVAVKHPDEIRTIFDAISYNKGASVIRMLHAYLGEKDFQSGLSYYLKKHAYQNTVTNDLWSALEEKSGKPVKSFMSAWTTLAGFPVLEVQAKDKLHLSQQRYLIHPGHQTKTGQHKASVWPIAIELDGSMHLINTKTAKLPIPKNLARLNPDRTGFYMINYGNNLAHFIKELDNLSALERLGLLNDTFQLAKAGYTDTDKALELLINFENENNLAVWEAVSPQLGSVARVFDDKQIRKSIRQLTGNLISQQLSRLGWDEKDNEDHFDQLLRPLILGLGIFSRREDVINEGFKRFQVATSIQDIPADLRGAILASAVRKGDSKTFQLLVNWHNTAKSSEDRNSIAGALTSFRQPNLIDQAIVMVRSEDVRLQDVTGWIVGLFSNRHAKAKAWQWFQENWDWLEEKLSGDMAFTRLPVIVGRSFTGQKMLREYNEFFSDKSTPGLERGIAQGREILEWQTAWAERDLKAVKAWLANFNK